MGTEDVLLIPMLLSSLLSNLIPHRFLWFFSRPLQLYSVHRHKRLSQHSKQALCSSCTPPGGGAVSLFSSVAGTQFSSTRCVGEQEVLHKIKTLTALDYLTTRHGVKYLIHSLRRKGHDASTRLCPAHFLSDLRPAVLPSSSLSVSCYTFIISNLVWPVLPLMVTGGTATFGP